MILVRSRSAGLILSLLVLLSACTSSRIPATSLPSPTPIPTIATFANPVLDQDFPDPDVLKVDTDYYVYATNANDINIQVAHSDDMVHWSILGDALPKLPNWAVRSFGWTWAREVFSPAEGKYVMYFTTRFAFGSDGTQCIGLATSDDPAGPFVASRSKPLMCQSREGGSIDPSMFQDTDGQRYLLWKNDGNSVGLPTWLYIQPVSANGLTLEGEPHRLLTIGQAWEGNLVEAPTLWQQDGKYYLFYSANAYYDRRYAVGVAVADHVLGPYTKTDGPLLATNVAAGLIGPGGQDIVVGQHGENWILVHGWAPGEYRRLYLEPLAWENGAPVPKINGKNPLPIP